MTRLKKKNQIIISRQTWASQDCKVKKKRRNIEKEKRKALWGLAKTKDSFCICNIRKYACVMHIDFECVHGEINGQIIFNEMN